MLNKNMEKLGKEPSAIRNLFEYGNKLKKEIGEDNVYDFSLGNPSTCPPDVVSKSLIKIINETDANKLHAYTSAAGDKSVREKIALYLNDKYNACARYENIYMTCGAASSLTITFNALLNETDEVILFAPFFPEYKVFIEHAKGKVVICESNKDTFQPDLNMFEKLINKNTKTVVINSPNNPTGVIYTKETLEKLAHILNVKEKEYNHEIYLISDEPYRELIYNDTEYNFVTNYYDNTIVCYSFSKSLSLPGERIGYIYVSTKCKDDKNIFYAICGAGRSLGYVCAPSIFQYLIPYCLGQSANLDVYKQNRDDLLEILTSIGYKVIKPDGAFYLFVQALEDDDEAFSNKAKEFNLLIVPSNSFGVKGFVRIAYCVSNKVIKSSKQAFKALFDAYRK